jgi:hypothetical protein
MTSSSPLLSHCPRGGCVCDPLRPCRLCFFPFSCHFVSCFPSVSLFFSFFLLLPWIARALVHAQTACFSQKPRPYGHVLIKIILSCNARASDPSRLVPAVRAWPCRWPFIGRAVHVPVCTEHQAGESEGRVRSSANRFFFSRLPPWLVRPEAFLPLFPSVLSTTYRLRISAYILVDPPTMMAVPACCSSSASSPW